MLSFFLRHYFGVQDDLVVHLGDEFQKGSLFTVVYTKSFWKEQSLLTKLRSIVTKRWPDPKLLGAKARQILLEDIFGGPEDFGNSLLELNRWHHSQKWDLSECTKEDIERADALNSMSVLVRTRFKHHSYQTLRIAARAPLMCTLINAMIIKVPILSITHFIDVHVSFTFNSIRRSKHKYANDLISFLYDLMFVQQKIAISLHDFVLRVHNAEKSKNEALLTYDEVVAITEADVIFTYLKASIEKTVSIIGLTHYIKDLDTKKTHKAKLSTLDKEIPEKIKKVYYWNFIRDFLSSDNLEELNSYRSGLLHKKGISDLQPHNFVGIKAKELRIRKIFNVLCEQQCMNTATIIGALALLTDELVRLDPPDLTTLDLPIVMDDDFKKYLDNMFKNMQDQSAENS